MYPSGNYSWHDDNAAAFFAQWDFAIEKPAGQGLSGIVEGAVPESRFAAKGTIKVGCVSRVIELEKVV